MGSMSIGCDRTVILASADAALRQRLTSSLSRLRWRVREACGGAEAIMQLEDQPTEALLLDHWLPDLEVVEFAEQIGTLYPGMDLLRVDGDPITGGTRSPRRHELLYALREALGAANRQTPSVTAIVPQTPETQVGALQPRYSDAVSPSAEHQRHGTAHYKASTLSMAVEEMVGESSVMRELARLIRLVAPRKATVLIEGETGAGKEVVANAIHRLSSRVAKPFVVLNCAAIPESLLEAELFGHTRGAFTGAVQSRMGRIEAAHGGTLFLDEIGEMPVALQAKMLRFLESGELQRVGDNATIEVDVRVLAATHQRLEKLTAGGTFRLDLYHRLAVFPLDVPPLRDRIEDLAALCEFFLQQLGRTSPRKAISSAALDKLRQHDWPGNVRELAHVLERASILAEDAPCIDADNIRLRRTARE
jgi:DNA-binding NtrC family response regulator